ncbi:MAG TPA: serine/threonine-protein kinase [Acidimicrobiia bacterium]|jgi:predicted Ser/Thr protein kinase|nr:serine/threonine-protein kinase [Acidimicrobiia bacterium]
MTPDDAELAAGYEVVGELGRGGSGVVLLARQIALDRLVAVKRVTGAFAIDPDAGARLRREAQILGRLHHPNIVQVFGFVSDEYDALIVMEYVEGASLDRLMARGLPVIGDAVAVLADVAAALTHAHGRGIVHRDVKPSNVMVANDGRAKLGDFGLARMLVASSALRTRPGAVMGTPAYMAPEQILGEETDARTDAYAFAAMAFVLLTGRPVFEHAERRALLDAHLLEAPVPPADVVTGFPRGASDAIVAGLAKTPATRPTAEEIARAIDGAPSDAWPGFARSPGRPAADDEPLRTHGNDAPGTIIVPRAAPVDAGNAGPIEVPVFVPPGAPRRRWKTPGIVAAIALATILVIAVASKHEHPALAIRDVSVAVSPRGGACPRATFTFDATIVGNGAGGDARVRWIRPDGARTVVQIVHVAARMPAHAHLRFVVDGSTATDVSAELRVLTPTAASATSPRAHYACS